jgi:hypothetical protein
VPMGVEEKGSSYASLVHQRDQSGATPTTPWPLTFPQVCHMGLPPFFMLILSSKKPHPSWGGGLLSGVPVGTTKLLSWSRDTMFAQMHGQEPGRAYTSSPGSIVVRLGKIATQADYLVCTQATLVVFNARAYLASRTMLKCFLAERSNTTHTIP